MTEAYVDLYWLPLGAGDTTGLVRRTGHAYERWDAWRGHHARRPVFHSALEVSLDDTTTVIEMAPVWGTAVPDRGAVATGSVGLPWLGRSRAFRYEVRRWAGGRIPDAAYAVESPRRMSSERLRAEQLLACVPDFPTRTWGLDELGTGEMWNSNSLVSWTLALSGHDLTHVSPPHGGCAPGWAAGRVVAGRRLAPVMLSSRRCRTPGWSAPEAARTSAGRRRRPSARGRRR